MVLNPNEYNNYGHRFEAEAFIKVAYGISVIILIWNQALSLVEYTVGGCLTLSKLCSSQGDDFCVEYG